MQIAIDSLWLCARVTALILFTCMPILSLALTDSLILVLAVLFAW